MADKNESYVLESQDDKPLADKVIIRTVDIPTEERFTLKQLEDKITRIDEQIVGLEADKAKVQEKIDEATLAVTK